MKRLHLFEFTDQKWLPARFRRYLTDLLQFHLNADKTYDAAIPILVRVLEKTKSNQFIDIGSGSSGPWKRWMLEKNKAFTKASVILTDKFPDRLFRKNYKFPNGLEAHPKSIDALNMPSSLQGARTFFTCFHHFKPEDARAILENAVRQKQAICIFEFTERKLSKILGMLLSPLVVLIGTFAIKPFSLARIFWTFIIPVMPLIYCWDGVVSHFRTYTTEELTKIHNSFPNDFIWECGQLTASNNYQKITYLIGYAAADGSQKKESPIVS